MMFRFKPKQKKLLAGFVYVLFLMIFAVIATAMLWQYKEVATEAIWMFLGVFSVMSIFFGLFFYVIAGRTAPDLQM